MLRQSRQRGLTTLVFTDIVGSSEVASELGDRRWRTLQARHHAAVRRELKSFHGREVDTAGDGFFATFETPDRGVRCAAAISRAVRELGLEIRAGVHFGEVELTGEKKVGGIAVTTAARVSALAGPGEILATDTVVNLVRGSGIDFRDVGSRELKGVLGRWTLSQVTSVDGSAVEPPPDADSARAARDRVSPPQAERGMRRSWLVTAVGGSILVLGLVTAAVVGRSRSTGPSAASSGAEPFQATVLALDADSGDVVHPVEGVAGAKGASIALSGSRKDIQSFAWVVAKIGLGTYGSEIWKIDRASGSVVDDFSDPRAVDRLAAADDRIWYPFASGSVASPGLSLRGRLVGEPERNISVDAHADPGGVGGFVAGAGSVWVGNTLTNELYRVDVANGKTSTAIPIGHEPDLLSFQDDRVWIVDVFHPTLTWLDVSSERVHKPALPLSGDFKGIAIGGGYVWLADASDDELERVPDDLRAAGTSVPLPGSPTSVAYADGGIYVGYADGSISKLDPTSDEPLWTRSYGLVSSSIVVSDGLVWVVGYAPGAD